MAGDGDQGDVARTLRILAALMRGEELDKEAAAKVAGINATSVGRNLNNLLEHVPGVVRDESGKRHVYRFDPAELVGAEPSDERVTLTAAIAVSLGAAFGRVFTGSDYRSAFLKLRDGVISRLAQAWKQKFSDMSRKFVVVSGREELLEDKGVLLESVLDAVLRERRLWIRYENFEGTVKERTIEPLSVAIYDAHLYVLGVDVADRDSGVRPFRFARIQKADVRLNETFPYPAPNEYDPEVLLRDSIGIWLGAGDPCRVRLRLDASWAVYARHHRWHESQRIVRQLEDGSVELEVLVRASPELEQWVLRFGEGAEVLEPKNLREVIAKRLGAAAARY